MIRLTNMKIGKRLAVGFGCLTVLSLSIAAVALWGSSTLHQAIDDTAEQGRKSLVAQDAMGDFDMIDLELFRIAVITEPVLKEQHKGEVEKLLASFNEKMDSLKTAAKLETDKEMLAKIYEAIGTWKEVNKRVLDLGLAGKEAEALALILGEAGDKAHKADLMVDEYLVYRANQTAETTKAAASLAEQVRWILIGVTLTAVVLAVLFGVLITRSISRPIALGVGLLGRLSEGDLTQELPAELLARKDEVGDLSGALARLSASLRRSFQEVSNSTGTLTVMSDGLQATSQRLSTGAKSTTDKAHAVAAAAEEASANTASVAASMEQASTNLASVASATEEMSATVGEIASNAAKARAVSE